MLQAVSWHLERMQAQQHYIFCDMHHFDHAHLFALDVENKMTCQLKADTPLLSHGMHSSAPLSVHADTSSHAAG